MPRPENMMPEQATFWVRARLSMIIKPRSTGVPLTVVCSSNASVRRETKTTQHCRPLPVIVERP
jgi:hypothetical protein